MAQALHGRFAEVAMTQGLTKARRLAEAGVRLGKHAAAPLAARLGAAGEIFRAA